MFVWEFFEFLRIEVGAKSDTVCWVVIVCILLVRLGELTPPLLISCWEEDSITQAKSLLSGC